LNHDIRGKDTNGDPIDQNIQLFTPIAANAVESQRLVLGTKNQVWESTDQGEHVTASTLPGPSGFVKSLAYGGTDSGGVHADVLYVGSESGFYLRPAGGAMGRMTSYPGGPPIGIILDSRNWQTAYMTDGAQVFRVT